MEKEHHLQQHMFFVLVFFSFEKKEETQKMPVQKVLWCDKRLWRCHFVFYPPLPASWERFMCCAQVFILALCFCYIVVEIQLLHFVWLKMFKMVIYCRVHDRYRTCLQMKAVMRITSTHIYSQKANKDKQGCIYTQHKVKPNDKKTDRQTKREILHKKRPPIFSSVLIRNLLEHKAV